MRALPTRKHRSRPIGGYSETVTTVAPKGPPAVSPTITILLTIGLTARITRLLVVDRILHRPRTWVCVKLGLTHPISYLVTCSWCMSVWVGAAVAAAWWQWGDTRWWTAVTLAATASLVSGWAANWLDPADEEV